MHKNTQGIYTALSTGGIGASFFSSALTLAQGLRVPFCGACARLACLLPSLSIGHMVASREAYRICVTYALVCALRKWSGHIGLQPVVVCTDHQSLQSWHKEHVDTPSGPAARGARWHETFAKLDLSVVYVPGKDNTVADCLSR